MNKVKLISIVALAASMGIANAGAQADDKPPGGHHRPPPMPLVQALDTNHDGVIDADEIANASASLKKLDKNGDGKLTPDEYRPPRPEGGDKEGSKHRPPPPPDEDK